MARIIESPGVQISEIDLSLTASLPVGTNFLINGFTDQGPSQELLNITSLTEYEQIYGVPTNAAERYSYHTIKNLLSTPAKVVFNRLPYGTNGGDGYNATKYSALLYPAYTDTSTASEYIPSGENLYIGSPTQIAITEAEYIAWKKGDVSWEDAPCDWSGDSIETFDDAGKSAFIIVNKIQTSLNQDFEGYYLALSDNNKINKTVGVEDVEFNSINNILTSENALGGIVKDNEWNPLKDSRLDFKLTGNISDQPDSISESVETIPDWDFGSEEYNDGLVFGLYKIRRSGYAQDQNALQFIKSEGFVGSLGADRKYTDPNGFQDTSFFLETLVNDSSTFMDIMVNPNLSKGNWIDETGKVNRNIKVLSDAERNNILGQNVNTTFDLTIPGGSSTSLIFSNFDSTTNSPVYIHATILVMWDSSTNRWIKTDGGNPAGTSVAEGQTMAFPPLDGWILADGGTPSNSNNITNISPILPTMNGDNAYSLGLYQEKLEQVKEIGDVPSKLKLGLRLAEDYEVIPLSLVLDAGISTIHTTMKLQQEIDINTKEFDDSKVVDISELLDPTTGVNSNVTEAWLTIFNQFDTFCRDTRKDCMFIADVYRNILVKGKDARVLDNKSRNFSQHVYTPLKNLTAKCNSSYSATYAQWIKVYDGQSSSYSWIPYSGFQGAIMSRLDSVLYPWSAPAGLENGLVVGGLTLALPSTQKQRDLLYRNNLNAVVLFPSDGMVCWGQKTLQKKPSAFDRINVRRLFLTLETSTRKLMKYFVFQPNTTFTRSRVVNILTPVFDIAKNNEGLYDYLIVCDERNNTPQVIDSNELQVDIYLKPVRTAEFILVNFYATRTDQNFNELT